VIEGGVYDILGEGESRSPLLLICMRQTRSHTTNTAMFYSSSSNRGACDLRDRVPLTSRYFLPLDHQERMSVDSAESVGSGIAVVLLALRLGHRERRSRFGHGIFDFWCLVVLVLVEVVIG